MKNPKLLVLVCIFAAFSTPIFNQCSEAFLSEIHYDNIGTDVNEFIEVAIDDNFAGMLSDYSVVLYNGSNGSSYDTKTLDNFTVGTSVGGFTYYTFIYPANGIQNGGPDGFALAYQGTLCEFLSYEGTFTGSGGPADMMMSTDIGVSESNSTTNSGESLQLVNGSWVGPLDDTPGDENSVDDVILISEVSVCDQQVEFFNAGSSTTDISSWQLCNFPAYAAVSSVTLISGSLNMTPGSYTTVEWSSIGTTSGEIGLYINGNDFSDPANIHDYVQYNSANNTRAAVAVSAGVWDNVANSVTAPTGMGCGTIIANAADPASSNSTTWCESASSTIDPAGANSACFSLPGLSIDDISMVEGNSGTSTFTFTVTSDMMDTSSDITFSYQTTDDTANSGTDYVGNAGTGTITAGSLTTTVDVTVNGDMDLESDETFFVDISNPSSNAIITDNQGIGTIEDDDTVVTCPTAGDVIITEIMQNPTVANDDGEYFEIYNTTGSSIDINGWQISDAGSNIHVIDNGGPLSIQANGYLVLGNNGDSNTNGGVNIDYEYSNIALGNSDDEIILTCDPSGTPTEIDRVEYDGGPNFPDPTGASMNLDSGAFDGTSNNDAANWCVSTIPYGSGDLGTPGSANELCSSLPEITIDDVAMNEGNSGTSTFSFTVSLSAPEGSEVTFMYTTTDGSATTADSDYVGTGGTGTIAIGQTSTTIDITVNGDTSFESDEMFTVDLSNPSANTTISDNSGTATIQNDDTNCPPDYDGVNMLTGTETGTVDYETEGVLSSDQTIEATADVTYDSATEINLMPNFEIVLGALFRAIIDGCPGSQADDDTVPIDKK